MSKGVVVSRHVQTLRHRKKPRAIHDFARAGRDATGKHPADSRRLSRRSRPDRAQCRGRAGELAMARWDMPSRQFALRDQNADPGVTNVRNLASSHWRRWLGPEPRCVVPKEARIAAPVAGRWAQERGGARKPTDCWREQPRVGMAADDSRLTTAWQENRHAFGRRERRRAIVGAGQRPNRKRGQPRSSVCGLNVGQSRRTPSERRARDPRREGDPMRFHYRSLSAGLDLAGVAAAGIAAPRQVDDAALMAGAWRPSNLGPRL